MLRRAEGNIKRARVLHDMVGGGGLLAQTGTALLQTSHCGI